MVAALCLGAAGPGEEPLTVAERSGWQATATHAEVMEYLERVAAESPVVRLAELGRSFEGRSLPLVVLSDPPLETAAEARAGAKAVVFALANIHAGEVCGKEALLMLTREIGLAASHPLLDRLVIVVAPIYNADGNERMSPENRPGQVGPAQGTGRRPNAQGLDLNRDHVKLESPEARALARFLTEWDPHLTIDTHTTNGSEHGYVLTYAAPLNPSGHPGSIEFVRDVLLPEVTDRLRTRTGYETFFYGNFDDGHTVWQTYSAQPRFGGPYRGLRGQMSILSEAYAYASYKDRVLATREFVREILEFAARDPGRLIALHDEARRDTIDRGLNPQPDDIVGIRHRVAAFDEPVTILGHDAPVVHLGRFEATRGVRRPFAYILGPGLDAVAGNLSAHGIETERFEGEATVEAYTVTAITRVERPFQGHFVVSLDAEATVVTRRFPEGSVLVRTAQPLGTLAVYLLEPESEDGLAAWNFLDDHLGVGLAYPVARVRTAQDIPPPKRGISPTEQKGG